MDFLEKLRRQIRAYLFVIIIIENAVIIGAFAILNPLNFLPPEQLIGALAVTSVIITAMLASTVTDFVVQPIATLWQAIQHVAPHGDQQPAPELNKHKLGAELVANLANHVYQLASVVDSVQASPSSNKPHTSFVATALPLPLFVLDKDENIVFANEPAGKYISIPAAELIGQSIYSVLDMAFTSEHTFDQWLKNSKQNTVTADSSWERVRVGMTGQTEKSLLFDLAAHYNKDNPLGYETMLVLFDHTETYSQDDQAMSFVALSVHELRTPLTLLRGYIEVFNEELGPDLTGEMQGFMRKMDASAQQLAAFVDNILNVAKIEDNQLTLTLREDNWAQVLQNIVNDLSLRANVRGITIKTAIATDLPPVGVDRYSVYEVVANLLDNAIKYSKGTNEIYLTSALNKDGLVETSVKDFGLGIDTAILPHIFDKFYRNHRNRAQIGGTGLGLFLSKAIVDAHGGQIWVSSKVNEGSTFSFTVLPYAQISEAEKTGTKAEITRSAHGWIKNHSLYRD